MARRADAFRHGSCRRRSTDVRRHLNRGNLTARGEVAARKNRLNLEAACHLQVQRGKHEIYIS